MIKFKDKEEKKQEITSEFIDSFESPEIPSKA